MREHKYRAWDLQFNCWLLPEDITIYGDGTIYVDRRGVDGGDVIDTVQPPQVVIEEYTGLKGKNSEEWYENDLITEGNRVFIIEYSDESLSWILTNPNIRGSINLADINSRLWWRVGNTHQDARKLDG